MTKIRLLLFFFVFIYMFIVIRLFFIQVLQSREQRDYLSTRKLLPERGKVYDVHNQPLVINQLMYRLFAEPKKIEDKEPLLGKIASILSVEEATLEARFDKTKTWVSLYSQVSKKQKDTITQMKEQGLGFDEEWKRYYPEASLAAHLLGFVGKDEDGNDVGRSGIEGFYNKELAGLPGLVRSDVDLLGRPIFLGTQERIDPENGRDIILTIDNSVQNIVKEKLKAAVEKYEAKQGCAIIANPQTMALLALSCIPDYDPQTYYDFPDTSFRNVAISDLYEPGSTFKPIIVASGIENGVIQANTRFDEDGPVTIGEYSIRTWNNQYEGNITITRALEKSSNVGMVFIGKKLGNKKVYDTLQRFGIGEPTLIDLEGEAKGYLKPYTQWYPIDFATATFGQGIAITPIQMIRAFSAVINGGKLLQPYVVHALREGQHLKVIEPKIVRRVIGQETSTILRKMLQSTIENGETKFLKPKGYSIGGKTGTAQIPIQGHYDASKTIASFIGFSPVDDPRFIGLVILKEPKTSQWGSETAAPTFFEIAKELIVYYNITPE